jgi:POT family proton-dependent oligopeptide transporter
VSPDLFGHPRGLAFLFATEMWERFSYYGMRALLVLYMVKYLLHPGAIDGVIGMQTMRATLEAVFGPLGVQPLASQIYGLYTALVYATPILGGWFADRVFGQRRTVVLGAVLMAAGHFLMAIESMFLIALATLIVANGCFKPNISTQVGGLYRSGDPRRDRAFSIFYVGINLGAFAAPLVCGTLGETLGWHWGFSAAGVGMLCGLAIYLRGQRHLPPDERARRAHQPRRRLERAEWRSVIALLLLFIPTTFFWATYEQQGNTIALWADEFTDRSLGALTIPVTWFQSFNPFMIFAFTPFLVALWARQARRGREPSTVTKMAIGCAGVALSNVVMAVAAWQAGADKASWLWLLAYFIVITLGELYLSPVSLSLVTKVAPGSILSMMMGVWLATSFTGNFIAGWLGSLWSTMGKMEFFLMIAAIAALASACIWALRPVVLQSLHDR